MRISVDEPAGDRTLLRVIQHGRFRSGSDSLRNLRHSAPSRQTDREPRYLLTKLARTTHPSRRMQCSIGKNTPFFISICRINMTEKRPTCCKTYYMHIRGKVVSPTWQ